MYDIREYTHLQLLKEVEQDLQFWIAEPEAKEQLIAIQNCIQVYLNLEIQTWKEKVRVLRDSPEIWYKD